MSQPSPFRISAVLAGFIVDIAATFGAILLVSASIGFVLGSRGSTPAEATVLWERWLEAPTGKLVITALGTLATVLGGYVAARMGRHAPIRHAAGLAVLNTFLGAAVLTAMPADPLHLAGLALTPVAALGGGLLVTRSAPQAVASA